jgi:hypothetical protein
MVLELTSSIPFSFDDLLKAIYHTRVSFSRRSLTALQLYASLNDVQWVHDKNLEEVSAEIP